MRPPALLAVLLSASVLAAGCIETEEKDASAPVEVIQPDDVDAIAVAFAPPEQVGSCVEQIKFGAFTGDAVWAQIWNDVGQTDGDASAYCTQLGTDDPVQLAQVHEGWLQVQAFLAAAEAAPTDEAPPSAVEPPAQPPAGNCDPSYPDVCIPPAPPELNCGDIPYNNFMVLPPDPHGFDGNNDGIGCVG